MEKILFKEWLINQKNQKESAANSRVSACQRVDNEYDIDSQYRIDACSSLLELFNYTKKDFDNGELPLHCIAIDGNLYYGTHSLKASIKLYVEFKNYIASLNQSKGRKRISNTTVAKYQGDVEGFNYFVGPYARNRIQQITKKEKDKRKGICEYCGKKDTLEAAHRFGEERPAIIKRILEESFKTGENTYSVDMLKFDEEFIKAHLPFDKHFYCLCKKCHKQYDSGSISQDKMEKKVGR